MYLNWYNNFWQLMREIGALDKFIPSSVIGYRRPGDKLTRPGLTNAGSPATVLTNMFSGVAAAGGPVHLGIFPARPDRHAGDVGASTEQTPSVIFFDPEATAPRLRS